MLYVCEFEITPPEEGSEIWGAFPLGLEGATQGASFDDAVTMAADWLAITLKAAHEDGKALPRQSLGHEPVQGGRVVAVAVEDPEQPDEVTAKEAAVILGVSQSRVTQLCDAGLLESRIDGRNRLVSRQSVFRRLDAMEA